MASKRWIVLSSPSGMLVRQPGHHRRDQTSKTRPAMTSGDGPDPPLSLPVHTAAVPGVHADAQPAAQPCAKCGACKKRRGRVGKQKIRTRLTLFGVHHEPPLSMQRHGGCAWLNGETEARERGEQEEEGEEGGRHAQLGLPPFECTTDCYIIGFCWMYS